MTELAMPRPPGDTPRSAYRMLERRVTVTTAAVLLALAGLAWWRTVGQSGSMAAMAQGFAHVGLAMPFDMTAPVFMAMWTTMMIAMMFPAVAPIVLMHRLVTRRRGEGLAPTFAFGASYLVVWSLVGLVPLAVLIGFRQVTHDSAWLDRAGGLVLLLAGLYQFSRWKTTCLRACRTPLSFLLTHDFGGGLAGAVRVGLSHGLYCLGCCWALMAVLFTVGLMNLAWMAGIALVFLAEKNWRHGVGLTQLIGIATALFGIAVLIHPSLLATVAPFKAPPPMPVNG
jgi:predicted metal-binding membrane protein